MGILNITPDSFYDGGSYFASTDKIIARALQIVNEGAEIIDIGGESTRPGSLPVELNEELDRVVPAVEEIRRRFDVEISIDTRKSQVAQEALSAGANWINDVSAGRNDEKILKIIAKYNATAVVMHSRENPRTMQNNPHYDNVLDDVKAELKESVKFFLNAGVSKEKIILDPGIGFAKTYEDNMALTADLDKISFDGYPILYAASRKRFLAQAIGSNTRSRLCGGLAAVAQAYLCGATIFRVHDVIETIDFLKVLSNVAGDRKEV
jgi:dihydropteroate synthase